MDSGRPQCFDAVDFAFTGEIGRLNTRTEARFREVAAHLDSNNGGSGVALGVEIDGDRHQLVRRVVDRKKAELDGSQLRSQGDARETDRLARPRCGPNREHDLAVSRYSSFQSRTSRVGSRISIRMQVAFGSRREIAGV